MDKGITMRLPFISNLCCTFGSYLVWPIGLERTGKVGFLRPPFSTVRHQLLRDFVVLLLGPEFLQSIFGSREVLDNGVNKGFHFGFQLCPFMIQGSHQAQSVQRDFPGICEIV